ncbi:hypothetical protein GLE_3883 [Lysobacter enzymogenes]|uniref:Uncharacterized protein n=1 Tax=Lysobacter enzymogenes TaxID=69 RepID=A0A0S2DKY0_LYSEN|nr:hypothetical protein GLE_3883 [Lysobacter enzymogenes]
MVGGGAVAAGRWSDGARVAVATAATRRQCERGFPGVNVWIDLNKAKTFKTERAAEIFPGNQRAAFTPAVQGEFDTAHIIPRDCVAPQHGRA